MNEQSGERSDGGRGGGVASAGTSAAARPGGELRAAEADRRRTVAELQRHYVDGRLTEDELGERVRRALAARTYGELGALLGDLPVPREVATGAPSTTRSRGLAREWGQGLLAHVTGYAVVMALLLGVWLLTTPGGYFWPVWPMLGWGIGLLKHARHGIHAGGWGGGCGTAGQRTSAAAGHLAQREAVHSALSDQGQAGVEEHAAQAAVVVAVPAPGPAGARRGRPARTVS